MACVMCDELRRQLTKALEELVKARNKNMKLLDACRTGRRLVRGSVPPGPGQPFEAHERIQAT